MSVEKTRAEILRLISKVNETGSAPRIGGSARRRLELTRLKEQRAHLATKLSHMPLMDRVTTLEQRLSGIEDRISSGGAAPPPSTQGSYAPSDAVFGGTVRETMLGDMLQLVTSQAMSGVFAVKDGVREILMYFNEGEIHHATSGDTSGEDAVFAAIAIQKGSYYFRETSDLPDEKTISANTQFLILEALRRIDEQGAGLIE